MRFLNIHLSYFLLPLLLALLLIRLWRQPFITHPLVFYLKTHLRKAGLQSRLPQFFLGVGIASLLMACLRPVIPFTLERISRGGLQIFLVLDISSSMNQFIGYQEDFRTPYRIEDNTTNQVSKLDAVKAAAQDFIARRPNDAIGLEVFSINAYVVSPPTVDHESLHHYLTMVDINTLIGEGLTSIGEGLNLAYELLTQREQGSQVGRKGRVIILFTDADHNYGRNPLPVISAIGKEGIHLYMVELGLGEQYIGAEIANAVRATGGEYFDASNPGDLNRIYATIETLEKSRFTIEHYVRNAPAFSLFAFVAVFAFTAYGILRAVPHWIELA